jgi:hypothetical protein
MRVTTFRLALFTALSASLATACDDGGETPEPSEVRQGVSQNLAAVMPHAQAALESDASARVPTDAIERLADLVRPGGSQTLVAQAAELKARVADPRTDAENLSKLLEKYLFNDANHLGDGVYPVTPQLVCSSEYDPQTGEPVGPLDADCEAALDRLDAKIRVRGDVDDLQFTLLLGPDESEPVQLDLSKTEIELHVDLGEAAEVVTDLAELYGEPLPNVSIDGRVAMGIEVLGDKHVEMFAEIEDEIDVRYAAEGVALDSAGAFRFSSAASKVFSVEIDAPAERLTAALDVGTTKLHTPVDDGDPELDLDLPGLSAAITVERGLPVEITGVSLGDRDLTVTANGVRAATVSLNAENGREVDITVTEGSNGAAQLVFTPAFDLRMDVNATALGEEEELYQVKRVLIDGATPTISTGGDALKVISGRFLVTTDPVEFGVEATAGQCVVPSALGGLEVGVCTL